MYGTQFHLRPDKSEFLEQEPLQIYFFKSPAMILMCELD